MDDFYKIYLVASFGFTSYHHRSRSRGNSTCNNTNISKMFCVRCGSGCIYTDCNTCVPCPDGTYTTDYNGPCKTCSIGYASISPASSCTSGCGDGNINDSSEYCDDGNNTDGDGCSSLCIDEDGWDCTTVNNKSQCTRCSNGVVDSEEECDDDNSTSGDGCSSTCKIESGYTCSHSSGGADTCTKQSFMDQKQVQSSQSATQAAMGVGFAASLLNISAPQGMYAMLGIFRMMIILPFIGAQMSKDVITYLTGLNFVMCSFSFLPVEKAPVLGSIIGYFDHTQENSMLSDFKIKSSSTFVNHFNIALIIVMVVIFHMMILMIYALTKKCSKLATSNIFPSVYLRVCIELSISVYLNGFVEIYQMKLSSGSRIISFCITLVVVLSLITINIVAFYKWIMLVKNQPTGTRFEEFFKGLKVSNTAYLYTVFIMMRRMLSIMIVTVCTSLPMYAKVVMFVIVQLVAWLYIVIVRPFNATKNNIIEVLNESIYLVLSLSLLYYNEINRWDTVTSSIVIQTLLCDSLIIALISMISICINIIKWLKSKYCKPSQVASTSIQIPHRFIKPSNTSRINVSNISSDIHTNSNSQISYTNSKVDQKAQKVPSFINEGRAYYADEI